jgi:hypothetical protein
MRTKRYSAYGSREVSFSAHWGELGRGLMVGRCRDHKEGQCRTPRNTAS